MSKGNKQVEKNPPVVVEEEDDEDDTFAAHFAELPSVIQRRVLALKKLHKDHLSLEKKYREEVLVLERKYQDLYAPLFQKRATVISGEHEPSDEETRIDDAEVIKADEKDKKIKGVPEFWLTVMKTNAIVGESITEADEEALKHLTDIRYTRLDGDKHGFQLSFHFSENPYFTNTVMTKTYHLVDDDNIFGELVFDRAEGCEIKWKPSKNLTVKIVKKQQKSRPQRGGKKGGAGPGRVTTVEEPCDSFFQFFSPPVPPTGEDADEEDGLIDDMLEADFETGVIFKDKLITHAALWFTGEALEFEDEDFGDEYDDFGDEDDEDDDEDEDDEDEEEEEEERPAKKGGRGGPPPKKGGAPQFPPPAQKGGAPNQPQQPECKQQ